MTSMPLLWVLEVLAYVLPWASARAASTQRESWGRVLRQNSWKEERKDSRAGGGSWYCQKHRYVPVH